MRIQSFVHVRGGHKTSRSICITSSTLPVGQTRGGIQTNSCLAPPVPPPSHHVTADTTIESRHATIESRSTEELVSDKYLVWKFRYSQNPFLAVVQCFVVAKDLVSIYVHTTTVPSVEYFKHGHSFCFLQIYHPPNCV